MDDDDNYYLEDVFLKAVFKKKKSELIVETKERYDRYDSTQIIFQLEKYFTVSDLRKYVVILNLYGQYIY